MKDPKKMTSIQLLNWLRKTHASFINALDRENGEAFMKNGEWKDGVVRYVDRYEELRFEAKERIGGKIWNFFCNQNGSCKSHDAYDILA